MIGLSRVAQTILGSSVAVASGFSIAAQSTPNMTLNLAAGNIFSNAAADATPFGALPADSTNIFQHGYTPAKVLSFDTTRLIAGQSQYAIVEVQFQQLDVVRTGDPDGGILAFYDSLNPTVPLQGENGLGGILPTVRQGFANVNILYGTPATTGSQTIPAASAGFVSLWAVNLTFGMTAITSAQISQHPSAAFLAGLENSHHSGAAGQAPPIKLTSEVQGILPLPNLPVSNTSPPTAGGSISLSGVIPIEEQGTVNPNGNVAGNAGDIYLQTTSDTLFVCTTTGSSSTAVWEAIGGAATSIYVNTTPYNVSNLYCNLLVNASGGARTINLPAINSTLAAKINVIKIDSSSNPVNVVPNGSQTINGNSSYVLNRQWQSAISVPDTTNNNWVQLTGSAVKNLKIITSSGSYTPTPGTKFILVAVVGGGGGGAGSDGAGSQGFAGGGGGGAGTAVALLPTLGLTFPATITIGTAGAGGFASGVSANTTGGNGTNSQFTTPEIGSALTGYGAEGGLNAYTVPGNVVPQGGRGGGALQSAALSGNITISSVNYPYLNIYGNPGSSGGGGSVTAGAIGGGSVFGGGSISGFLDASPVSPGGGFGAGGGSAGFDNATAMAGGAGTSGACLIIEFIES